MRRDSQLPVIALVGRSNVGKSTLFNRLTKTHAALVADQPGVTRDRQYGCGRIGAHEFLLIDTGGLVDLPDDPLAPFLESQAHQAIQEADYILFVVDGRAGLQTTDKVVADALRKSGKSAIVVVNKIDGENAEPAAAEFYQLGWPRVQAVSARQGYGIKTLLAILAECFSDWASDSESVAPEAGIKIAIMGKPNVGKSTLVNQILGEERVIVYDSPGTTRDSIYIPFQRAEKKYVLIDTAGIRRRARIQEEIEKLSIVKSMQAAREADIIIFMIDSQENVSEQDLRLLRLILEIGTPIVIAINKWDALKSEDRRAVEREMDRRMGFVDFAKHYFISAARGTGIKALFSAIDKIYRATQQEISTGQLTKVLEKAVTQHEPPLVHGRRIRLRYAHLGGRHPMTILIHGKQTKALPDSYARYLAAQFRAAFHLIGIPIHIKLKTDVNPYDESQ